MTGEEVTSVVALTDTLSGQPIDVEEIASVSMRPSGGALATLHAGYLPVSKAPGYTGRPTIRRSSFAEPLGR